MGQPNIDRKIRIVPHQKLRYNLAMTPTLAVSDERWTAIRERDANSDNAFVYAVTTTRIYCRPSCPSRKPKRSNVRTFHRRQEAEDAGFRPCKRCRPQDARSPQSAWIHDACDYIEGHATERWTLADLSAHVGVSPYHLHRMFKREVGVTPRAYADARRLRHLKGELKNGSDVTRALYAAGYGSSSRLYERAPDQLGMTPATYRRGGPNMTIYYSLTDCPLGRLLVAATERGISAVSIADSDEDLERTLREEYPAATLRRDDDHLGQWVEIVLDYLDGQPLPSDLPLDIRATAFQRRVWDQLRRIPHGQTRSYREVADAIGRPKAVRAVANACASNPVPLVIPCHRVVRSDGGLGGYGLGLRRKRALLEQERDMDRASEAG